MNRLHLIFNINLILFFVLSRSIYAQEVEIDNIGTMNYNPGFNFSPGCNDIVNGVNYHYLSNNKIRIHIGTTNVGNGFSGSKYPGSIMDVVLSSTNLDNIDWTQFMLTDNENFDLNNINFSPLQDSIKFNNNTIDFYAKSRLNSNIKFKINYCLLPDLPIIKYKIKVYNYSNQSINKFLTYVVDVDEYLYDHTFVPNLGYNTGDYTKTPLGANYIYYGPRINQITNNNVHGITWVESIPNFLVSNTLYYGISYKVALKSNDSTEIIFYQLVDLPFSKKTNSPHLSIEKLSQLVIFNDPEFNNKYHLLKGTVENQQSLAVSGAYLKLFDDKSHFSASTTTDTNGNYQFVINKSKIDTNNLRLLISSIGYKSTESKIILDKNKNTTIKNYKKSNKTNLIPQSLDVSFDKRINVTGAVSFLPGDLVLENNSIVAVIANRKRDLINVGDVVDYYPKNYTNNPSELLDWYKPNKLNITSDTLDAWWLNNDLLIDTLFIKSISNERVIARLEARVIIKNIISFLPIDLEIIERNDSSYTVLKNIKYITEYELRENTSLLTIHSKIINSSNLFTYNFFVGDAFKTLGANVRSYLPEKGEVKNDFGKSSDFLVNSELPWIAHYGKEKHVYGLIYDRNTSYKYAVIRWAAFKDQINVKPGDSISFSRHFSLKIASNDIQKEALIRNEYYQINKKNIPVNLIAEYDKKDYKIGDSLVLKIHINNYSAIQQTVYVDILSPYFLKNTSNLILSYSLLPNQKITKTIKFSIIEGGRDDFKIYYNTDTYNVGNFNLKFFVKDKGWFAADNHTHSIFSDGASTIENNLLNALSRNVSIMTATDHNTLNHFNEVSRLASIYKDMLILAGNEVTTSQFHLLAYNIKNNIPWSIGNNWSQQNIIDSINNQNNKLGNGYVYVAHPCDPTYYWRKQNVNGLKGLEVWNSYNLNFDFNDLESKNSFRLWDSLNLNNRELFGIANSDAHNPIDVGANYTRAYLSEFTNSEVVNVYRDKGCFYGSNGPHLNFTINNNLMGSKLFFYKNEEFIMNIRANTYDKSNKISEIRLIRNGILYKVWYPNKNYFNVKFIDSSSIDCFYRIELVADNNNYAFSNPIWIKMNSESTEEITIKNHFTEQKYYPSETDTNDFKANSNTSFITNKLKIYPIPTNDIIYINNLTNELSYEYSIFDIKGSAIKTGFINNNRNQINLDEFESGFYMIVIIGTDVYERKLIKVDR